MVGSGTQDPGCRFAQSGQRSSANKRMSSTGARICMYPAFGLRHSAVASAVLQQDSRQSEVSISWPACACIKAAPALRTSSLAPVAKDPAQLGSWLPVGSGTWFQQQQAVTLATLRTIPSPMQQA